jgi:hypothetical protein
MDQLTKHLKRISLKSADGPRAHDFEPELKDRKKMDVFKGARCPGD